MKKLTRIPAKGMIAGVMAGFADYFAVDVTVLRVLYVLLVCVTGLFPGVVAYFLAVVIMPADQPVIHEVKDEPAPSN